MSLPNLLIVGAPKAGTGSLFAYLAQHPDVCPSSRKEIKFFSPDGPQGRSRSLEWYERFFAHRTEEPFALEATPSYCYMGPVVLEAIASTLEQPRCVLILREPVDRLWSAYTFQRSLGHLPTGMDAFEPYVQACVDSRASHPRVIDEGPFKGLSIGMYGDYVPGWDAAFGHDLRLVFFDDLVRDPHAVVRGICSWLELDEEPVDRFALEARNVTVHPRSMTLARGAASARTWSKTALRRVPGLRRRLRDAYLRANAGRAQPRPAPQVTDRLHDLYAMSNATLAAIAERRGDATPAWLRSGPVGGDCSA